MLQDFRLAARTLLRSPGFTATAALTLALGIGVTSLMVGVVDAVLLRPLPYADPGRLMLIFNTSASASEPDFVRATALDFEDYRSRAHRFDGMAAHVGTGFTLTSGGEPELGLGQLVTPDFFRVLGVPP